MAELVANFELNNPSIGAEFEFSNSANFDALFQITHTLYYEWLDISENDWVKEGNLYKYTYSGLYTILNVYKQVGNTLNLILVNIEVKDSFIYLYCQEPFNGKAIVTDMAGEIRKAGVYKFEQGISSAHWVINHKLNTKPSVTVVDSSDKVVIGEVIYVDSNTIHINFSSPFTGQAYLNYTR